MRPVLLVALGLAACEPGTRLPAEPSVAPTSQPRGEPDAPRIAWHERFAEPPTDWVSPSEAEPAEIAAVYQRRRGDGDGHLHARHDPTAPPAPPAVHWGRSWRRAPLPMSASCHLSWRWRVHEHPQVDEPWGDLAASIYVITAMPSIISGGEGFKLGWLSKPGPKGTDQRGIRQIALRVGEAGSGWHAEEVDLCAFHRRYFGDPAGAKILYVGVVTDADDSETTAEADYDELVLSNHPRGIHRTDP